MSVVVYNAQGVKLFCLMDVFGGERMEPARSHELTMLLDFYGALLTEKQHEMMRLRVEEDLSLSEIADGFGVSRQAVHDALRKAEKTLTDMEEKLHLVEKYRLLHQKARLAMATLEDQDTDRAKQLLTEMQKEGMYGV